MDSQKFLDVFGHIANAPGGIDQLRLMIFQLAVTGSLTPRLENDQSASELLKDVASKRQELVKAKQYKRMIELEAEPVAVPQGIQIPESWEWSRLLDLGEINPRNAADDDDAAAFLPMRGVPDAYRGSVVFESGKWGNLKKGYTHFAAGDVVLAKITPCFENGKAAVIPSLADDISVGGGTTELLVFRPIHPGINADYIYLFLRSPMFAVEGEGRMTGTAGQKRLPTEFFATRAVPWPPTVEQIQIVAKVDELMALCDQLEKQQEVRRTLQVKARKALIQTVASTSASDEILVGWGKLTDHFGDLFSCAEDVRDAKLLAFRLAMSGVLTEQRASEQLSRDLTESKEARANPISNDEQDWPLPSNWGWVRAGWLGDARLGKMLDASKNRGEMMPYLRNINVRWRKFDLSNILQLRLEMHELPKVSVAFGDLVICEGGEPGRAAIWDRDEPFVIQKALHRFRCGPHVLPEYMLLCLEHDYFTDRLDRYYTGATIKHLTGRSLSQYTIPLPPIAEQKRILERIEALLTLCTTMEDQLRQVSSTAESLALAAVSGITGIAITEEEAELKAPQTELIAPLRIGTPPSGSVQAPLASILVRHSGVLSAKELWQRFGGEIDSFYAQLKHEVAHGWIVEPEVAEMRERETA
jgi:type I restriction enzyme S subunit